MPVVPGNALQERLRQQVQLGKRPQQLGRTIVEVRILMAYDADAFDRDGIPPEIAHLVAREPGTMFAKVKAIKSGREFYVPFYASEAEILKTHGNAVLLRGLRGTIVYSGVRPEQGRLVLMGEPTRPLRNNSGTSVADVVSFLG